MVFLLHYTDMENIMQSQFSIIAAELKASTTLPSSRKEWANPWMRKCAKTKQKPLSIIMAQFRQQADNFRIEKGNTASSFIKFISLLWKRQREETFGTETQTHLWCCDGSFIVANADGPCCAIHCFVGSVTSLKYGCEWCSKTWNSSTKCTHTRSLNDI